ncbi:uncharacterized protein [Spinacia oleracea]|uniref:DDE Tnp4 domain-containing protein n=1 Tax=Spinacia oleracea TaxID=3562 RepID=A0A9R0JBC0_SPIOL|nr:uncharacterized protein LOC110802903 [Spinacia oleracea]
MLFRNSSSSESFEEDQNQEIDQMIDEIVTHHLPNTFSPRGPRRQTVNDVYLEKQFRRRFRMRRPLFCGIMNKVVENDTFMQQRGNAAGKLGLSGLQKCTATIRILAYEEYLRSPTDEDLRRILYQNEMRGFPGMIESIDCMHWEWKNCPNAWKGQYQWRSGNASLILEAVADQDLWIWHSFFGILGSCSDLNVLYRSLVFDDALQGFTRPQLQKHKLFADRQAHVRKDVERAFGVLQARFSIIRQPSLAYDEDILSDTMKACLIMHNIIVEDERDMYIRADVLRRYYEQDLSSSSATVNNGEPFEFQAGRPVNINDYLGRRVTMRNSQTHQSLKDDLIEHNWKKYGPNNH